jgi:chromosome partitioning protein
MRIESQAFAGAVGKARAVRSSHVIVVANEKGGSGKTTTAIHVVVALLKAGQRVATIDIDSRQKSLSRYVANRKNWSKKNNLSLEMPDPFVIDRGNSRSVDDNEAAEFAGFAAAITAIEHNHDFIVIDTPATDSYLMRLAHSMADTLITPLNDSFIDFDVLASVDPENFEVTGTSHYSEMVRDARRQRRLVEDIDTDWIVMRNRLGQLETRNGRNIAEGLVALSRRMSFRMADGFSERVVYRELFPRGVTVLDTLDEKTLGVKPTPSHDVAREEVLRFISTLRLPIDERGKRRAAARAEWFRASRRPFEDGGLAAE